MKKFPKYDRTLQPTFSPYDINKVDSGGVISAQGDEAKQSRMRTLTFILLGFVLAISLVIVVVSVYYGMIYGTVKCFKNYLLKDIFYYTILYICFLVKRNRNSADLNTPRVMTPDNCFQPLSTSTIRSDSSKNSSPIFV